MDVATAQYDIFPPDLVAKAIRDNGYKTTAHAIAELIDNSVQAAADQIQVFCIEEQQLVQERRRHRVTEVAVLDDGHGMDAAVLRIALQFGNGTHLDDRSGIGRFGMGLPTASLSQCKHVQVWTWQTGPDNALYSYLNLDEIMRGDMREVPEPEPKPVPERWRAAADYHLGPRGTLVVWSELDRVNWRGASATLENTEFLVGRMYRKMLHEHGLRIRLAAVREHDVHWEMDVRVNDPLYGMSPSSTPDPFGAKPMFRPWGQTGEQRFTVELDGERHVIAVRCAFATDDAMSPESGPPDPGRHPYGKHAKKNRGVSIVRAGRELELDTSWNRGDIYRDRWWGIEVEFPPALDEIFGVTNNKQAATNFTELASFFDDDTRVEEWEELREMWRDESDPRYHLMDVAQYISDQRNQMRTRLRQMRKGSRKAKQVRHKRSVEDRATERIRARQHEARADIVDDTPSPEDVRSSVIRELVERGGLAERDAREIAEAVVTLGRKVVFVTTDEDSNAFFSPKAIPGVHEVRLNLNHPVFVQLVEVLDPELATDDVDELRDKISKASDALKLLLCAWVRYELEAREVRRRNIAEMRREWGKMARLFVEDELDD